MEKIALDNQTNVLYNSICGSVSAIKTGGLILIKGENSKAFYRIPKYLFSDEYKNILSTDAKLLYALLLDRTSLSAQNGWLAEDGRVFIYFSNKEASDILGWNKNKITRLFAELEKTGLIQRKGVGRGRASVIFVNDKSTNSGVRSPQKVDSRIHKKRSLKSTKISVNNTEYNNNYFNNTYLPSREEWEEKVREQIEYDVVICMREKSSVDSLVAVIAETLCGYSETYRINNADVPYADVRERLLSLDDTHIVYAVDVIDEVSGNVRNIRSYMLAVLYNAPVCMDGYYQALVNKHMSA